MSASFQSIGDVACLVIEGDDARRFAQTQFSGDVDALVPGHWQWNAWLTAQGRVSALMHLVDTGDGTLLALLRGGDAEAIRAGLTRYLLRMRATLTARTCTSHATGPALAGVAKVDADGAIVMGYGARSLRLTSVPASPDAAAQAAWRLEDIRQGWPRLAPGEPEFLPPALGLERLGAVNFDKGCYPGQEIAARLHYRGGHKSRLFHVRGSQPLTTGPVRDGNGAMIAWVLDAVDGRHGVETLLVASVEIVSNINIMGNIYSIVSRFDV